MSDMMALAARLEATENPTRELGHEVLLRCGWTRACVGHFYGPLYQWSALGFRHSFQEENLGNPLTSIDVAMWLIPDGWSSREIRCEPWWLNPTLDGRPNPNTHACDATIHRDGHESVPLKYITRTARHGLLVNELRPDEVWGAHGYGHTMPLALCAAVLRARAA